MDIRRTVRSVAIWIAAISLVGVLPASTAAATIGGVAPKVILDFEGSLTRNPVIELIVMPAEGDLRTVVERRAANVATVVDGVLSGGQTVPEDGDWTLASGPDGLRTVYGQLHYADGTWSPITSATITLKDAAPTSLYFDIDPSPVFFDYTTSGLEPDWHERSTTPTDRVYGYSGSPLPSGVSWFSVNDGKWSFTFMHPSAIVPGSYEVASPGASDCTATCAVVGNGQGGRCAGDGAVVIHEIAFAPGGDLDTVSADYRLDCSVYGVMSGSIRYGSSGPIQALDQSIDFFEPGTLLVGQTSPAEAVTLTNIGTQSMDLGPAILSGEFPADYDITEDHCSGATLGVGQTCLIKATFTPTSFGYRFGVLSIPDETAREGRRVRLTGSANQTSVLAIAVEPPAAGPGTAAVTVTMTPASGVESNVVLTRDDKGTQPLTRTVTTKTNPSRVEIRFTLTLTPGAHHLTASDLGGAWHPAAEPASVDLVVPDSGDPWGFVVIHGGPTTTSRTVQLTSHLSFDDLSIDKLAVSNDGVTWEERIARDMLGYDWTLSPGAGTKTVYLRWHEDGTDQWSPVVTDSVELVSVPTVTAPTVRFLAGTGMDSGRARARVSWVGSSNVGGALRFELEQSIDGGAWTSVSSTLADSSIDRLVSPGHTYRYRVTAIDADGHESSPATGATIAVARYSENNRRVSYTKSWITVRNAVFLGGAARKSKVGGASASITFTGRSIAWIGRTGPDRGKAEIYVNGKKVASVDLWSSSYRRQQVVWVGSWSTKASRTVTIRVLGTSGRPRVDLDAFITAG